jgi:branched-chain amino acid transport system ATP-binding protein
MMKGGMLLAIEGVVAGYGRVEALHGVSLQVRAREIVTLNGPNGAGKTTLLNAVMGLITPRAGRIRLKDRDTEGMSPEGLVRLGVGYVPERRQIFSSMTVLDNLWLGAYHRYARETKGTILQEMEAVFSVFPVLGERRRQVAGTLSGGQQQMLALGRALMAQPDLLLLDEPSLGLAPLVVAEIMRVIAELRRHGMTVLLVEQNARAALTIADRGYVMEGGRIVLHGPARDLLADERVQLAYLGGQGRGAARRNAQTGPPGHSSRNKGIKA